MEKFLDACTARLGRPAVLVACGVACWIAINLLAPLAGNVAIDPPPFPWLFRALTFLGLAMGILILSNRQRAAQLAEQREHTTLELARATERKVAKVLELVEELRRNGPALSNGSDREAEQMPRRAGPDGVKSGQ
jgi:uncharacterized membrane protein